MGKTLAYIVRHGTTDDSKKNIIRGAKDSKLDRDGFNDAHALKTFFKDKEWDSVFSSDRTRAIQTAKIIAESRPDEVKDPIKSLMPWDVGYLTGKDKTKFGPDMKVFVDNPDMRPQGGETLNDFSDRVDPLFMDAIEIGLHYKPCIVIAHSSVIHALAHFLWGDDHKPLAVKPGGVIEVFVNDKGDIDAKVILKPGKDDSSFAGGQQPTS